MAWWVGLPRSAGEVVQEGWWKAPAPTPPPGVREPVKESHFTGGVNVYTWYELCFHNYSRCLFIVGYRRFHLGWLVFCRKVRCGLHGLEYCRLETGMAVKF